nr:hypothetical protein [Tanacetum cinerariifolium]
MSCSNHHSNFSRKPRMSVRQVWKRKTSTPNSSLSSQKDSLPLPSRVYLQSPSPPSYNPLRDQMINQLHNISTILDSHTNPSNAYIHAPPSPPPQQIHPPSHAQVEFYSSFCHSTMAAPLPLLEELAHVADSDVTKVQLIVLFEREVDEDAEKIMDFCRLSRELRATVRRGDGYIAELEVYRSCDDTLGTIKMLSRM